MPRVTFGVISDLHCRLETDARDSFLTVGSLRLPANRHPVQSLIDMIAEEGIVADILLNPGDLTNKARREGLTAGWDYSREIAAALQAPTLIPVIGNHDIVSRRDKATVPVFHDVRNLHPEFPFRDPAATQSFFSDGYCVIRIQNAEIIAVNTVIDGTDDVSAKRGQFGIDRIARMEAALTGTLQAPIRVALMHHHPTLHSGSLMGDGDVLETGDMLLDALGRLGCGLVVHGHKHLARLSSVNGLAVLASGSLSAMLLEFGTSFANTFHLVTVDGTGTDDIRGVINTWAFRYASGWKRAGDHCGLPFTSGFGNGTPVPEIAAALQRMAEGGANRYTEDLVRAAAPTLDFLTPMETQQLAQALRPRGLKLSVQDDGRPELLKEYRP
jgi:predicted phosphodiesterase